MREHTELGMFSSSKTRIILVGNVDDTKNGWKVAEVESHVEEMYEAD